MTTTQGTSKSLKAQMLLSVVLICFGIVWWMADMQAITRSNGWSSSVLTIGFAWYLVTRLRIWWYHR